MTGETREFYDEHQPDGSCCFEVVRAVLEYHGLWGHVEFTSSHRG
jgi:hypothetical protein